MQKAQFYNQNGTLTAYSLSCGYVETISMNGAKKSLFMEHSHYHVQSGKIGEKVTIWEVYEINELTKARKFYNSIKL